jgi:thioredoxin-like negative regulator of GroEL
VGFTLTTTGVALLASALTFVGVVLGLLRQIASEARARQEREREALTAMSREESVQALEGARQLVDQYRQFADDSSARYQKMWQEFHAIRAEDAAAHLAEMRRYNAEIADCHRERATLAGRVEELEKRVESLRAEVLRLKPAG